MEKIDGNQIIAQMRLLKAQAQGLTISEAPAQNSITGGFKEVLNTVNDLQMKSGELKTAFQPGDSKVNLAEVMVASQKANIAFQGTLQIRNRMVQAYQDIMNMPI